MYESNVKGYVKAFAFVNGLISHRFFMAKTAGPVEKPDRLAYPTGKVPIKQAKRGDLNKLKDFIPHTYLDYYQEIFDWPTTAEAIPDSDFEEED